MRRNPVGLMMNAAPLGDVVWWRIGRIKLFLVSKPDGIQRVLHESQRTYGKQTRGYQLVRMFLGNGLLTAEGEFWRRQRRIAQPAFHRQRVEQFGAIMQRAAGDLAKVWDERAQRGQSFDVGSDMMRLTLRIVGECLLSTDPSQASDAVGSSLSTLFDGFLRRSSSMISLPLEWPLPEHRRIQHAVATLDELVHGMIRARRANQGTRPGDLLDMLMDARDEETGERMDDKQLRDEVMTVFLAGHETTSNALSWTWYLLGRHPEIVEKLHAELDRVLAGRPPTFSDLPALPYTLQVLKESMRLYPPVWAFGRSVTEKTEILGARVEPGNIVFLSPYVTHRHPEFWPDPERFDPDRFLPERMAEQHRFAYFPFGGGPRVCIGNTFALMEGQLVLATLAQRHRLRFVDPRPVELWPQITLRPRGELRVVAEAQNP